MRTQHMERDDFIEEQTFVLRFCFSKRFPEDDESDDDNYEWIQEWENTLKPQIIQAVFTILRSDESLHAHVRNRGRSPDDEIEIVIEHR